MPFCRNADSCSFAVASTESIAGQPGKVGIRYVTCLLCTLERRNVLCSQYVGCFLLASRYLHIDMPLMQIVCSFHTTKSTDRTYLDVGSQVCTCCVPAFASHLSPRRFLGHNSNATKERKGDYFVPTGVVNEELYSTWKSVEDTVSSIVSECMKWSRTACGPYGS